MIRKTHLAALLVLLAWPRNARADVVAHRSEAFLPSSNGIAAVAWDRTQNKLTQFLEHPYRHPSAGVETRNFAFDSYAGLRIASSGKWLDGVAPVLVEYVPGTGVVHAARDFSGLRIDEYDFAPIELREHASVMLVEVTRTGGSGAIDAYALFNYHLGSGGPLPGADNETIAYDASRDAYYESGPAGVAFGYASLGASTHHGSTPDNPYASLQSGANLADDPGTGGATNDAVAGLQRTLGDLAVGASAWAGWVTVLAPDADAPSAVDRVRTWIAGRGPQQILADEKSAWRSWIVPAPSAASPLETSLAAQSQVTLRMGQVAESGAGGGQILAAVAPGRWNTAWVRDMAYSTVALAKSGHAAEARDALAFQLGAQVGAYQKYVGAPYAISVVRYFGDGTEESDSNADGPNIELDGFGLFLWALDEYVKASGDTKSLAAWWPVVKSKVADVLAKLQEPTGLVAADSSIWEVHWNGKQRHFAYTTIAAANGLCAASRLAQSAGDGSSANAYLSAGQKARDAILARLRAPDATIAQSVEGLASGSAWLDAATIEAIDFGLVDPTRRTARATLQAFRAGLVPPSGRGFMRSDVGDWYSSQEWIFVDLRAERAVELHGDADAASSLLKWNVDQASENFGQLSELHDRVTADYQGQSPMVGFGAGAYLIALLDRGKPVVPTCGSFASEPADAVDAGPDAASGNDAGFEAGSAGGDAGAGEQPSTSSGGGAGCGIVGSTPAPYGLLIFLFPLLARLRRRA